MQTFNSIKEILDKTGKYTGKTMGSSMMPIIHQNRDDIIVVKNKGRLKKYDVPVYVTKQGKYIMHRVVKVYPDHYVIVGDNLKTKEYVTDDMIIGKLKGFYRNGKKYIDLETNKAYKLYSKIWVALLPIRPVFYYANRALKRIKNIFSKKSDA